MLSSKHIFGVLVWCCLVPASCGDTPSEIDRLVAQGEYSRAEAILRSQIPDPDRPAVDGPSVQLEILRRIRRDFALTGVEVLDQLRKFLPGVTRGDVRKWTMTGHLMHRTIDGETRYFRKAATNLFLLDSDAKARRDAEMHRTGRREIETYPLVGLLREILEDSDGTPGSLACRVRHRVTYSLCIKPECSRVLPGAVVRAWLPYPQEYRQQSDVVLLCSKPDSVVIAPSAVPHRTAYFESVVGEDSTPPTFLLQYEFTSSPYCPLLTSDRVEPYDSTSPLYLEYTAERPPHIFFSREVRQLARQIVGDESNPLEKTRLIFRWVSENVPWVGEMEYSIIPSLSAKGLAARCGDCGVQGMAFITLCRAVGVPARWQSGFGTKPGEEGMHDWAEFYIEPWGWLPADVSYGVQASDDPRIRDFFCGGIDPYRLIVNMDYARPLTPPKASFRSEPNDFQRGEVEIDGHNLYFDDWTYTLSVQTERIR
ncbi:transglutaminase-like domain-containing protein [Botrimarina hoheduenensis]|nr:transglutaminase domain-containing protein [Botrimarina hoheduenensis]